MVVEQAEPSRATAPTRTKPSASACVLIGAVCGVAWGDKLVMPSCW